MVAIEIAHQTDTERDIVQVIAVDVAAVDLATPAVSHFNLAVAGRSPIANHEVISQPILHPSDMAMVIIERSRVALPRSAIMDDDKLPTTPLHGGAADLFDDGTRKIAIALARPRAGPRPKTKSAWRRRRRRLKTLVFLKAGFFDDHLGSIVRGNSARNFRLR